MTVPVPTLLEATTKLANDTLADCRAVLAVNRRSISHEAVCEHYSSTLHGAWLLAASLDPSDTTARDVLKAAENEIERLCEPFEGVSHVA